MKSHGMELSLNKNANVSSNDTPTPTRFIRNCEAIGLFQDLNPFEETFKRAIENSKRGSLKSSGSSFLSKSAGDDLHTPQVFLDGLESQPCSTAIGSEVLEEIVVRSEADTSIAIEGTPAAATAHENASEESVHVLFQMPNGTVLQLSAKPVKNDGPQAREAIRIAPMKAASSDAVLLTTPSHVTTPQSANPLVKEKLKAFLDGSNRTKQGKILPIPPLKAPLVSNVQPLKNSSQKKTSPVVGVEERKSLPLISDPTNETDEDKKRRILERNRKAAYRCREKRKRHMESLLIDNKLLAQEVTALRAEVLRLQSLLAVHDNCPLTSMQVSPCVSVDSSRFSLIASAIDASEESPPATPTRMTLQRKESLRLDIARATENTMMDLDSPSIVRCDEVLSSVAPPSIPSTPDEKSDPFLDLDRDMSETLESKINATTTTVIQLNPNVLKTGTPI